MIKKIFKTGCLLNVALFGNHQDLDKSTIRTKTEDITDYSIIDKETGWHRVKKIFLINEFGDLSNELVTILHVGAMSFFIGAIYGGTIHSKVAYQDFIKNNQATAFKSHLEAKRKLQDKVTISFGKGAFKWGWRLTIFCTSFMTISTIVSEYRGKNGILEYIAAGCFSGALYKLPDGPRSSLVGGSLGLVLGLIGGIFTITLLKLAGMSTKEMRYWQYYWMNERNAYVVKKFRDYKDKEEFDIIVEHNKRVGEAGNDIRNIDNTN